MDQIEHRFEDDLEPLGIVVGTLLVLAGLGTIAGTPWTTAGSLVVASVKVLGALATVGVGAGLASLSWTDR